MIRNDGFDVFRGAEHVWRVRFDDIISIEAYKRDELTTDLVCFDVLVAGDPPGTGFLHEDVPGWADLIDRVQVLPGFDREWSSKVAQPPFKECRTVVYERQIGRLKSFVTKSDAGST